MNLYFSTGGKVLGPYSENDVRSMVMDGSYPRDILVCPEGRNDWNPFSDRAPSRRPGPPVKETPTGEQVYYQAGGITVTSTRFHRRRTDLRDAQHYFRQTI